MKCSGENVILRGIVHVVSGFPLHFMLYRGNLDCFSYRVPTTRMKKMARFLGYEDHPLIRSLGRKVEHRFYLDLIERAVKIESYQGPVFKL